MTIPRALDKADMAKRNLEGRGRGGCKKGRHRTYHSRTTFGTWSPGAEAYPRLPRPVITSCIFGQQIPFLVWGTALDKPVYGKISSKNFSTKSLSMGKALIHGKSSTMREDKSFTHISKFTLYFSAFYRFWTCGKRKNQKVGKKSIHF